MKKTLLTLFIGGLLMTSTYATPSTNSGTAAVCYFSCTGNTKALAETTAKALNADLANTSEAELKKFFEKTLK